MWVWDLSRKVTRLMCMWERMGRLSFWILTRGVRLHCRCCLHGRNWNRNRNRNRWEAEWNLELWRVSVEWGRVWRRRFHMIIWIQVKEVVGISFLEMLITNSGDKRSLYEIDFLFIIKHYTLKKKKKATNRLFIIFLYKRTRGPSNLYDNLDEYVFEVKSWKCVYLEYSLKCPHKSLIFYYKQSTTIPTF